MIWEFVWEACWGIVFEGCWRGVGALCKQINGRNERNKHWNHAAPNMSLVLGANMWPQWPQNWALGFKMMPKLHHYGFFVPRTFRGCFGDVSGMFRGKFGRMSVWCGVHLGVHYNPYNVSCIMLAGMLVRQPVIHLPPQAVTFCKHSRHVCKSCPTVFGLISGGWTG